MTEDFHRKWQDGNSLKSLLNARQDADKLILYLDEYILKDAKKQKVPGTISMTHNRAATFAAFVIAELGVASEQYTVESMQKGFDAAYVENFRKAAFEAADENLAMMGMRKLDPWLNFHGSIRGGAAARCGFGMKTFTDVKGRLQRELVTDIAPWDVRFSVFERGSMGLTYAGIKTTESRDDIEAQYGESLKKFRITLTAKEYEFLEAWDTGVQQVWVGGKLIFEEENKWGFVPVVHKTVTLGSMLADTDSLEHEGESIFWLIRLAIPEMNRLMSIMQTLNMTSIKPPVAWKMTKGKGKVPAYTDVMTMSKIIGAEIGGGPERISFGDAQASAQIALANLDTQMREASTSALDLSLIDSPPASGIRAIIAGENRGQLLNPRLNLRGDMKIGLGDMLTEQVDQIGGSIEMGVKGHKEIWDTGKLKGPYSTKVEYFIKSGAVTAGQASLAASLGILISDDDKRIDILKRQDPVRDKKRLALQELGRQNPQIKTYLDIMAVRGEEPDLAYVQAMASLQIDVTLDALLAGDTSKLPGPQDPDDPTQVLKLFGGGQSEGV